MLKIVASFHIIHKFVKKFRDSSPRSVMPTLKERQRLCRMQVFFSQPFLFSNILDLTCEWAETFLFKERSEFRSFRKLGSSSNWPLL